VYAFARGADDLADEGELTASERLVALDRWRAWLHESAKSNRVVDAGAQTPVFVAVADTVRRHSLPLNLFDDLVSAFAQDVTVTRYATWEALLDYCRRSANPIGRLVLQLSGYRDDRLDAASDRLCTALQLTNFWQDLERDWRIGRLYLPEEEWRAAGAHLVEFDPSALSPAWHEAMRSAARRTRTLFNEGRSVCDGVAGRLRYELRLTWLGGTRILERLESVAFDTVRHRPTLGAADAGALLTGVLRWKSTGTGRDRRP
jgi:squalene synthase HpnC